MNVLVNVIMYSVCLQVINNACATQAIVSVLLNCSHPDVLLGDTLTEFNEFSLSFDAAVSVFLCSFRKQMYFFVCTFFLRLRDLCVY